MDVLFFPGLLFAIVSWFLWYHALRKVHSFRPDRTLRLALALIAPLCLLTLLIVLMKWSSQDVRSDAGQIFYYMIFGAVWLRFGVFLLSFLGIVARQDVLERQNRSAAWGVCGAMVGTTFCFAGANIGSGPGAEVVLFCAVLSTAALLVLWMCLERVSRLADRITIERDEGAGIRAGAWMAAVGLVLGSAVAGDWESLEGTLRDFARYGWVALTFLFAAITVEWYFRSRTATGSSSTKGSAGIAATYLMAAGAYVLWLIAH